MGDILADIAAVAEELADAHQHRSQVPYWDHNRHRKFRTHLVALPGLLDQLYESVYPASQEGGTRQPPGSRPPLSVEALGTHTAITAYVTGWCVRSGLRSRGLVTANLRALVGAAGNLPSDDQRALLADLRRWRTWCAVMTGWERVDTYPGVPCPVCGETGTLRVNLTSERGYCTNQTRDEDGVLVCGSTWSMEDGSLPVLGRHITSVRARQEREAAVA